MSTPIVERIAVYLAAAIDEITIAGGFNQDLVAVRPKRVHLEGDINTDLSVLIFQGDETIRHITDEEIGRTQRFSFQALVLDSDTATDSIDTRLNQVRSDIEKQLLSKAKRFCGGLAEGILLAGSSFGVDPTGENSVAEVNFDVLYKTQYTDPYTGA